MPRLDLFVCCCNGSASSAVSAGHKLTEDAAAIKAITSVLFAAHHSQGGAIFGLLAIFQRCNGVVNRKISSMHSCMALTMCSSPNTAAQPWRCCKFAFSCAVSAFSFVLSAYSSRPRWEALQCQVSPFSRLWLVSWTQPRCRLVLWIVLLRMSSCLRRY